MIRPLTGRATCKPFLHTAVACMKALLVILLEGINIKSEFS
jgi:hypothetical protein